MKRVLKKRYLLPIAFLAVAVLGPKKNFPTFDAKIPKINLSLNELDEFVAAKAANLKKLKPENGPRIVWADSIQQTDYSIVYLHGFSASPKEGDPIHLEFAKRYGCNIYIPLIAGHGLDDDESFLDITPKDWMDSAKEAIAVGSLLGKKLIVMSCSTGGTLAAYLAANNPQTIHAQIMYSPNIRIYSSTAELLSYPWGLQIARLVSGGNYMHTNLPETCHPYWNKTYRVEGAIALKNLLDETMTAEIFKKITQPLFVGFYYKNEEEQDKVVSVAAMREFYNKVSTSESEKRIVAFPNVGTHILASGLQSKDLEDVRTKTYSFAEEVLGLKVIK